MAPSVSLAQYVWTINLDEKEWKSNEQGAKNYEY